MKAWLLVMFASFQVSAMSLDETLRVAIQAFELEGNVCSKPLVKEPRIWQMWAKWFLTPCVEWG